MESNIKNTALIFEGGGMRACFSAGVATRLLENEIYFDFVAGISAGSSCTISYLARDKWRLKYSFVDSVKDPNFGGWKSFLKGKGYFNSKYLYEESAGPSSPYPFDVETLLKNPADFAIGAYNIDKGKLVYWNKSDITDFMSLMSRVRASSSLPVLMPVAEVDGDKYIDGGVSGGIALEPAIERGYEKFVIVLTRPRGYRKDPVKKSLVLDKLFKDYPQALEAIYTRYIRYNESLDLINKLEKEGKAVIIAPNKMEIDNREMDIKKLEKYYHLGQVEAKKAILDIEHL